MARIAYSQTDVQAEQRLIESFWHLLESEPFRKVTISQLSEHAHCNRATFYYHYEDSGKLLQKALEQELVFNAGVISAMAEILSKEETSEDDTKPVKAKSANVKKVGNKDRGTESAAAAATTIAMASTATAASATVDSAKEETWSIEEYPHLLVAFKQVDRATLSEKLQAFLVRLWTLVLCQKGETLNPDVLIAIAFLVEGLLGAFSRMQMLGAPSCSDLVRNLIFQCASDAADLYGFSNAEVAARLRMIERIWASLG